MYTQQTPDHTKATFPPHLEIDFPLESGATLNILNNDTWNGIKEYCKLQLKASRFFLSVANNSKHFTENSQEHFYTHFSCI